jgi:FAD/FMN-containing dehydrogenase
VSAIADFVATPMRRWRRPSPACGWSMFGHLGDGNLHYNVSPPRACRRAGLHGARGPGEPLVHDAVCAVGGSISAEHGLGVLKRDESAERKSPVNCS